MTRVRYSAWRGSSGELLAADDVFGQLNDYLNETGDLQQAMRRLMQCGVDRDEKHGPGLDELMARVAREIRRLYERRQLENYLDQVGRELRSVVERERQALDSAHAAEDKARLLDNLSSNLSSAIEQLSSYSFEDPKARFDFEALRSRLEEIRRVENMLGEESGEPRERGANGHAAQDLMDRLESLRRLEEQLSNMDLGNLDLDLLEKMLGGESREDVESVLRMQALLEESGYVLNRGHRFELTPRGVRKIGQLALRDIYQQLKRDAVGRHPVRRRGAQEVIAEATRPYVQGEALNLSMIETLKSALRRKPGVPLQIRPSDFAVHDSEQTTRAATVLLLDMSWSMSWDGRFAAAKKVALAMESLVRSLHPRDYFGIVGFFTRAVELKPRDLPEATWNMGDPFTNLQEALHLGAQLLDRRPSRNQQIIVITDGQPTAYCRQGRIYCEWPLNFGGISQRAAEETLKEAGRVTRKGITINTFMLDDSPVLRGFVNELTRINRGRAFYTRPDRLGEYLLVDYVAHRKKKI